MTDDTLREECKQLAEKLALSAFIQDDTDVLLAFARAQQAKGMKEAVAHMQDWFKHGSCDVEDAIAQLEAQATAREAEKHRPLNPT